MTKVLGFRADPSNARYAIVEYDGKKFKLQNGATESKLVYPSDIEDAPKKVLWLYREIERIFHANPDIARVVIKTKEFGVRETKAMRESTYLEAALMLYCEVKKIPVCAKVYTSLDTRSADVKDDAEKRTGRTAKYWDTKIADAIVAACWGAENP